MKRICLLLTLCCFACSKAELADQDPNRTTLTRAVPTPSLDWENCDWMPTPVGQSAIPSPWSGAGSIAAEFGMEATNDRYRKDGWELMYNTFTSEAPGPLINPYFMLYNKYRGLLRVYLYVTTQFITTSNSLKDGLQIVTPGKTSVLNFLDKSVVDISQRDYTTYFSQIRSTPENIPSPVASNKWYMFQYELAYDPALQMQSEPIHLSWHLDYIQIQQLQLSGKAYGLINGTIGGSGSSPEDNLVNSFIDVGKCLGKGVIAGIGKDFLEKNKKEGRDDNNTLNLPSSFFDSMYSGISSALSGSIKDLPKKIINVFSAVLGVNQQTPTLVDLRLDVNLSLEGSISSKGSFPSMPIVFKLPGTSLVSAEVGYIPSYDRILGVVGFAESETSPILKTYAEIQPYVDKDPYDGSERSYSTMYMDFDFPDYTKYIIINPEVEKLADIFISQDLVYNSKITRNLKHVYLGEFHDDPMWGSIYPDPSYEDYDPNPCVQFKIEVRPKNGDNPSIIIKTIRLKEERTLKYYDVVYLD